MHCRKCFRQASALGLAVWVGMACGQAKPPTCVPPLIFVDTSSIEPSVGDGSPASCTEEALRRALAQRNTITFRCGPGPVVIAIGASLDVAADRDIVIDGANSVSLDGQRRTRIFSVGRAGYRSNTRGLTLQRIRLVNGAAPGSGYVAPDRTNPKCAFGYAGGAGGAIEVRDAALHLFDVTFEGNAAATPGPDIGGGAVFAAGSLDVTIVGSRFLSNTGANAGAVGLLQTDARIFNSIFQGNGASGSGQNYATPDVAACAGVGHAGQGGSGGNGGAIAVDGSSDTDFVVCGTSFIGNTANELAGAVFRTMNGLPRRTVFDRTFFQGNRARQGGALFIMNASPLEITGSTFASNAAEAFGAGQFVNSRFQIINSTFVANEATRGLGGALMLNGSDPQSVLLNATFAENKALGGSGLFGAALSGSLNFRIRNSVFANNVGLDPSAPMQCGFAPAAGAENMQWPRLRVAGGRPDTPCVTGAVFQDPELQRLAENGGPTATMLPGVTSPLRAAGRDCPLLDQRGVPRDPKVCTTGAVE